MMQNSTGRRNLSASRQLELGLRWLAVADEKATSASMVNGWREFLARAETLPPAERFRWARFWPLWGAFSGVLALSGLLVWPGGSGIHLLVFLMTFWTLPLLLMAVTAVSGLILGRTPWWRPLVTPHSDRVIALWFARQSLLAQAMFCVSGLVWLWLLLASREVIFYWSTSIAAVSLRVDKLFHWLGAGVVEPPAAAIVAAAEAGSISGWEASLLADSWLWALWLTQLLALWILLPAVLLLLCCHWRLIRGLARWPRYNHRLRLRYEALATPAVNYRALQPEQPALEPAQRHFPGLEKLPDTPGFAWQATDVSGLPEGCRTLGGRGFEEDRARIAGDGRELNNWYIPAHAVPTGDLADLLQCHLDTGARPRLHVLAPGLDERRLATLEHSWSVFLARNDLPLEVFLVTGRETPHG